MRRSISVLIIFALLLLLPGCGKKAASPRKYTLNPDGTIDDLRWGMTYAQAARRVKQIAQDHPDAWWGYEPAEAEVTVSMPQGTFLGQGTGYVHLIFRHFTPEGKRSPLRLAEIRVSFYPEAELEDLCSRAEGALTLMEARTDRSWASPVTLEDRISREVIEELYNGFSEGFIQQKCDAPLYTASVSVVEYQHKLLTTNGYYAALAEIPEK